MTASIGIVSVTNPTADPESVLSDADAAMHLAEKRAPGSRASPGIPVEQTLATRGVPPLVRREGEPSAPSPIDATIVEPDLSWATSYSTAAQRRPPSGDELLTPRHPAPVAATDEVP